MKATATINGQQAIELRKALGLNQTVFWAKLGVTQSGGCRYESGRNLPRPVQTLFRLIYINGIDITTLRADDVLAGQHLRETAPAKFQEAVKAVKAKGKKGGVA